MPLTVTTSPFGSYTIPSDPFNPIAVTKYTLTNTENSFSVSVMDFGAIVTNLFVPNSDNEVNDIVLGFDTLEEYLVITSTENPYFGACIGRTSNRIRRGQFILDGQLQQVSLNDGAHHLHGGFKGFDKRQFKGTVTGEASVTFAYVCPDKEEGYPNAVLATVTYSITENNELVLEYKAMSDGRTPISMTNHSYFNITGHKTTNAMLESHSISLNADTYTPVDDELIITGEVVAVGGTKFDLRNLTDLNAFLNNDPSGFDHNFCINNADGETLLPVGRVVTPKLTMTIQSTQPGLQFYTGNFLPTGPSLKGKEEVYYYKHGAFCAETQSWPDAVNHPTFPNVIYNPGQLYSARAIYAFT